jgi:hypothetical protein
MPGGRDTMRVLAWEGCSMQGAHHGAITRFVFLAANEISPMSSNLAQAEATRGGEMNNLSPNSWIVWNDVSGDYATAQGELPYLTWNLQP